jgi:D-glycero-alpha-D-manno-heptose 1-phosphate guanylyltransferase
MWHAQNKRMSGSMHHAVSPKSNDRTKAVLLVGGLGTRLRSVVPSKPKPLASVGSKSFLELLVEQLCNQGIQRLVMCTGYLADRFENEFGDGHEWGVTIEYSKEPTPLGTAGAVKFAQPYLQDLPDFLVMNGDSFVEADFHQLFRFHRTHGGLVSIVVVEVDNACRYGTVEMDDTGRVGRFLEKTGNHAPGIVSAGVYIFNRAVLEHIPEGPASLESNLFPQLLDQGVFAFKQDGMFIDIGTPEDYARAQKLCDHLNHGSQRTTEFLG